MSKLGVAVMVSRALAFALPIAVGSAIVWGAYNHLGFLELSYTLGSSSSSSGVGSVFQYIVFNILWVAFFWLVIASIIAGGIEMATAGARPVLEMFGLPVPTVGKGARPEAGFRTMFTAIVAWEIVNAILQSVFGITPPSPISALVPPIQVDSIGFMGTIVGMVIDAVELVPLIIYAVSGDVEIVL